jgi:hypothetical protein
LIVSSFISVAWCQAPPTGVSVIVPNYTIGHPERRRRRRTASPLANDFMRIVVMALRFGAGLLLQLYVFD